MELVDKYRCDLLGCLRAWRKPDKVLTYGDCLDALRGHTATCTTLKLPEFKGHFRSLVLALEKKYVFFLCIKILCLPLISSVESKQVKYNISNNLLLFSVTYM